MVLKRHIAIVYLGDFFFDARLINMSLSLQKSNYIVSIIDIHTTKIQSPLFQDINFHPIRLRNTGKLKYFEFHCKAKNILNKNQYDIIISGDLYSLSAVSGCKKNTKKIIYDCRELYFELSAHTKKPWYKYWNYCFEKHYLQYVDHVIVTAKSDLQYLQTTYRQFKHLQWGVVYNYPYNFGKLEHLPSLNFNEKNIKIIYQGVLQRGRGVKLLLDLAIANKNIDAIIVGGGEQAQYYQKYSQTHGKYNNIFFIDKVPYLDLLNITAQCDIGWAVITNKGLSNKFALPNKLFEYLMAGIPVIGSDLPNIADVITKYNIGKIIQDGSAGDINKTVYDIYNNKKAYQNNILFARKKFNWDIQHNMFMEIVND